MTFQAVAWDVLSVSRMLMTRTESFLSARWRLSVLATGSVAERPQSTSGEILHGANHRREILVLVFRFLYRTDLLRHRGNRHRDAALLS